MLVLGAQFARGAPISSLFGAYEVVGEESYDVVDVLKYVVWHLAELDLYVAVIPFAAFLLLAARIRSLEPRVQSFVAATIALTVWTLLIVAAFASRFAGAIVERNMFMLATLLLIGLLVWIDRGGPRPRVYAAVAACVAAVLPALIPYERFLQLKVRSDTLMIVPLWNVQDEVGLPRLDDVVLLGGIVAAALFLLVPRRYLLALPAVVLAYFVIAIQPIQAGPHGMEQAAAGALFEGIRTGQRDWIDRAAGDDTVAVLWTGKTNRFTVLMNEFFNRSVGPVYTLGGPMPGGLPETAVRVDPETGEIRRVADGSIVEAGYVLTDGTVALDGDPVAADEALGITLYGVGGPLVSTTSVTGVDNDLWSGPEASYRRVRCHGGTLEVTLGSDPATFNEQEQTVLATDADGNALSSITFSPRETVKLRVPLRPQNDVCTVHFLISPTVVPGGGDLRELGARFLAFDYKRP